MVRHKANPIKNRDTDHAVDVIAARDVARSKLNMNVKTYIGLGSNLGDPVQQVRDAVRALDNIRHSQLEACSSLYLSEPVSDIPQEDYINAVACLSTTLTPTELLLELQAIEHAFYRQRDPDVKWDARTLDLDIILFGELQLQDTHLTIPHPHIPQRRFVLEPLREIAGDLYIPGMGSLDYLIQKAPPLRMQLVGKVLEKN